MNFRQRCLADVVDDFAICLDLQKVPVVVARPQPIEDREAGAAIDVEVENLRVDVELVDLALYAGQADRFAFNDPDDDLIRQDALNGCIPDPIEFLDTFADFIKVRPKHVGSELKTRFCKHLVFLNPFQAGHGKLLNFEAWGRPEIDHDFVSRPAEPRQNQYSRS